MSSNTLLMTVNDIKARTVLHANVDEKLITPDIKFCQDSYILPILGSALLAKLQTMIAGAGTTGVYDTLRKEYIFDALMYYVLSQSPTTLSSQLYNKGAIKKTSENTVAPDMQDIIALVNYYQSRAEFYGQKLIDYLKQNHTLFPEYTSPGSGIDTVLPEGNAYKTTFYLDDCDCGGGYLPVSDSKFKTGCR